MAQTERCSDESLVVMLILGKGRGNDAHGTWDGDAPNLQRSAIRYIDLLHAVCIYRTAAYAPTPLPSITSHNLTTLVVSAISAANSIFVKYAVMDLSSDLNYC